MKKKNLGLIIAIIIVLVIVVIVGAFIALYFLTDLFKSEQQIFWKYISNNSQLSKIVTNENEQNQKQWKENNSYTSKGTLKLSITAKDKTQEINLGTTSKHNNENDRTYSDVTLYNGNEELLKASYINSGDVYAIQCEDIYNHYIGFRNSNLKEFATKMGIPEETVAQIPDSIPFDTASNVKKINEEELKYLSDTYSNILMENVAKEKYTKLEKNNITIRDKNYETSGYQLALNQNDIKQIVASILTKAKDDEQTIAILNKIFVKESESEPINVKEMVGKLLDNMQEQELEEANIVVSVYNVGEQITKTQININDQAELTIDLDVGSTDKEYVEFNVKPKNEENEEQKNVIKLTMEKQKLNDVIDHTVKLENNITDYQITMNTSLGNVTDNKMENNSKITISDNDTIIETAYHKTTQLANEEIEIQELTNSNTAIVNNYSMEQLETFFTGLGERASQVLPEKIEKLNIQLSDSEDILYYIEGIASSIFTVANANGVPTIVGTAGVTAITLVNQITKESDGVIVKADNAAKNHESGIIKEKVMLTQANVQKNALSGKGFKDINDVKTTVEEQFFGKYEIIDWGNINFNSETKMIEGTITIKSGNKMYLVDFTNQKVEEES